MLGSVHRAGQLADQQRLDPETIAEGVRKLGKEARVFASADSIAEFVIAQARPGDLLLVMSNGSFDGLCEKLVTRLGARSRVETEK